MRRRLSIRPRSPFGRWHLHGQALGEIGVLLVGLGFTIAALRTGVLVTALSQLSDQWWLAGLVSGMLYSSVFTVGPSIVILGVLATQHPLWQVAVIGGIGAMLGDLVVFHFLKSGLSRLLERWTIQHRHRRIRRLLRGELRWVMVVLGAVIVASPLPDEVGLALMGIGRLPPRFLILMSFALNGAGIFFIGLGAQAWR